jgi:hypothetical protein
MKTTRTLFMTGGTLAVLAVTGLSTAAARPCTDADSPDCPPPPQTVVHKVGIVDVAPGQTLGVRYVPRQNATQYRQLPDGGKALITCQTRGSKVTGTFGTSRIWNHLKNGGYVSDAYVYTGSDGRAAPPC